MTQLTAILPQIVPVYAALLALLFVWLSLRVIRLRGRENASFGDGGSDELRRAIRAHANFAEYGPIGLFLLLLIELTGHQVWLVNLGGAALLFGRMVHAYGVSREAVHDRHRRWGMRLTLITIIAASLVLLAWALGLEVLTRG